MDALLNAPDQSTQQGCRDHTLLLFLYNTGARAGEVAQIKIADLLFAHSARDHSLTQIATLSFVPQTGIELHR
jgi:site-specific recombinase XerD